MGAWNWLWSRAAAWIWFRTVAFWAARTAGWLRRKVYSGLFGFWSGFILTVFAVAIAGAYLPCSPSCRFDLGKFNRSTSLPFLFEILVLYSIVWWGLVRSFRRKRLVVLATVNHASKDFDLFAGGLSDQLVAGLTELKALYIEQDQANPRAGESIAPPIIKFDAGDEMSFAEIVGEKSSVKLQGFEIPLRPLVALLERPLTPRRRLTSSVQRSGPVVTLLASISDEEITWRVDRTFRDQAPPDERADALTDAKEELLYRIFASMSSTGSKEWRAVKEFSAGLRAYRLTLSSDMNRALNLREAEKRFFAARSLDKRFAQCSYNLGIVYRERGKNDEAAIAAFLQALGDDPSQVEAAYALSVISQQTSRLPMALEMADRGIAHAPAHAQAWNMKGYVSHLIHSNEEGAWGSSLRSRNNAVAFAWKDLCRAEWRGSTAALDTGSVDLVKPFINLAVAYGYLGQQGRAARILRQAIRRRATAGLHFERGKLLASLGRSRKAVREYRRALSLAATMTERARYYSCIVEARARNPRQATDLVGDSIDPYVAALASPSDTDAETRQRLMDACQAPDQTERRNVISTVNRTLESIQKREGESDLERLGRLRAEGRVKVSTQPRGAEIGAIASWSSAIFAIQIAELVVSTSPTSKSLRQSEYLLRYGVTRLERYFPAEKWLGYALERLAESLRLQSKFTKALPFAERAVALDLFFPAATRQLGLVHFGLADYDRAEQELKKGFALDPSDAQTLQFLGSITSMRGATLTSREARRSEFRNSIQTYDQALDLANNDADRGRLHVSLGDFHFDLCEYDSAEKHYSMAKALSAYRIECRLDLALMFIEQGSLDRAEQNLRDTVRELKQSWRANNSAGPIRRKAWLRGALSQDEFSDPDVPRAWVVLWVCLLGAQIFAERGRDISRARRHIGFVARNMDLLVDHAGDPKKTEAARDRRLDIEAAYRDQCGWLDYLEGLGRPAREHIEASVRIRESADSLCHLARLYLDGDERERALECLSRARKVDVRGVLDSRIAEIEAEARMAK